MLMAVYSHYMVNDKFERIAPALVSVKEACHQYVTIEHEKRKSWNPIVLLGILPHADRTTSDRLAIETRGRATSNGERSRR